MLETGYGSGFAIRSYYQVLTKSFDRSFPWKIVWKSKVPSRVALFVWTAALENILTIDNLRKRQIFDFGLVLYVKEMGNQLTTS